MQSAKGTSAVWTLAVSPDGKQLLTGGAERTVRLWRLDTDEELQRLAAHTDCVKSLAFSPDGRRALSCAGSIGPPPWQPGNDFAIRLWQLPR
jgi:WD40 repeat protein